MKQLKVFIIALFILFSFIVLTNYIVNPFGVFNTGTKISRFAKEYQRYFIIPKLKMKKNANFDYAVFGSSNTGNYCDEKILLSTLEKRIFLVSIDELSYEELYELIQAYVKLNSYSKKIFISLEYDPSRFAGNHKLPKYDKDYLNFKEISFLLFSRTAFACSCNLIPIYIKEMIFNVKEKSKKKNIIFPTKPIEQRGHRNTRLRYVNYWGNSKVKDFNIEYISKIYNYIKTKNIDFTFYTNPLNSYALADIYLSGGYEDIENFKRKIVKITPFYDFLYSSVYSEDAVSLKNKYWVNVFHGDFAIGKLIMKKLIFKEGEYGIYVTEDNIEEVLKKEKEGIEDFIKQHKKEVAEYRKLPHLDMYEEKF